MTPRICAVGYLNSTPLVWGMLHGPEQGAADLRFEVPARCADLLLYGEADIGLVPAVELDRQPLEIIPGLGIASSGAVRSILLIAKREPASIQTLAADNSSRTSVALTRVWLRERYGVDPEIVPTAPDLDAMLERADAALIIGDPALRLEKRLQSKVSSWTVYDLGEEWTNWTGLPMVYAVWAARAGFDWRGCEEMLTASWTYGHAHIDEICQREAPGRGIDEEIARVYLTRHIEFELGENHHEGLAHFRHLTHDSAQTSVL